MPSQPSQLGSLLRALLERLDPAVERAYRARGLDYRPRFTPVIRALARERSLRIKDIAQAQGLSHSAVSQTVTALVEQGWVTATLGKDGRERWLHLTPKARSALPLLEAQWRDTAAAAESLSRDLGLPLEEILRRALETLERVPFEARIDQARVARESGSGKP